MLLTGTILEFLMKKYHILLKIQKNKEIWKDLACHLLQFKILIEIKKLMKREKNWDCLLLISVTLTNFLFLIISISQ